MDQHIDFLNSKEAARILGVNVSSVKRWTDSGKLECIQTKGGHRKFQISHLAKFLADNRKKTSRINFFPIETESDLQVSYHVLKGDFEFLKDFVYQHALSSNRHEIHKILSGLYLGQYPLHEIYDLLLTPVLHRLGDMWLAGKLSVVEEHLGSQSIRDCVNRLQGIINIPRAGEQRALCINLSNELHDIALKMVQNILELKGIRTFFSGQLTPAIKLENILDKIKPHHLYVSATIVPEEIETQQKEVNQIYTACHSRNIEVYIGGRAWDVLKHDHPAVRARLFSFEEVHNL